MRSPAPARSGLRYGIEDALRLMRSMPVDRHLDLVITVFRTTLASAGVPLREVIDDATRRQAELRAAVQGVHGQIGGLEAAIRRCHEEIATLRAEHVETTAVKRRLEQIASVSHGLTTTAYTRYDL